MGRVAVRIAPPGGELSICAAFVVDVDATAEPDVWARVGFGRVRLLDYDERRR